MQALGRGVALRVQALQVVVEVDHAHDVAGAVAVATNAALEALAVAPAVKQVAAHAQALTVAFPLAAEIC